MSQNRSSIPLILAVCAVLALAAVVLFTFRPDEKKFARLAQSSAPVKNALLEQLKDEEMLGGQYLGNTSPAGSDVSREKALTENLHHGGLPTAVPNRYTSHPRAQGTGDTSYSSSQAANTQTPGLYEQAASRMTGNTGRTRGVNSYTSGGQGSFSGLSGGQMTDKEKASETPFSPYLAALTKEQADSLSKQLDGLTDRVQAAVLRALLPKSKKDANIEKYLARHQATAAEKDAAQSSGKFAEVSRQIAQQKAGIVKNMQASFGDKAARQAGQLMDAYQKELMDVLNNPNLTPEQIQQKTREISKKYNDKLQKLSEKSGLEKMKNEHETRDNAMQHALATAYGDEMAGKLSSVLAKYRQNELNLVQQRGLDAEEFFKLQLENDAQRQKAIEKLLLENGQPLGPYRKLRERQLENWLAGQKKLEENGEALPVAVSYSKEQQDEYNGKVFESTEPILQGAQNLFGEQGRAELEPVVQNYRTEVSRIMANPETTLEEKNQLLLEANQKMNNERKEKVVNMQVEKQLEDMFQNPALANVSPQEREAFERQARPVLRDMYSRANDIMENPDLTERQKEQQLQALQEESMRKLSGQ